MGKRALSAHEHLSFFPKTYGAVFLKPILIYRNTLQSSPLGESGISKIYEDMIFTCENRGWLPIIPDFIGMI